MDQHFIFKLMVTGIGLLLSVQTSFLAFDQLPEYSEKRFFRYNGFNFKISDKASFRPDTVAPDLQIPGLAGYSGERRARLLKWQQLASNGDPFIRVVEKHFAQRVEPGKVVTSFKSSLDKDNAWAIASGARQLMRLSFAGGDPRSKHFGRQDLVQSAYQLGDAIIERIEENGWWIGPEEGDPNINRFTMVPLLASMRYLDHLPEFESHWQKWEEKLWDGVKFHRRGHREGSDIKEWDYGARFSPRYPNMDAAYICILGLAADIFDRPGLLREARHRLELLHKMFLPGGGIGYIHEENEIPVYHNVNACFIGLYYKVTLDPLAYQLLQRMSGYFPSVLTEEGDPVMWTAGWWKQRWMSRMRGTTMAPQDPAGMAILAGINDNKEEQDIKRLMWASLSRIEPTFQAKNQPSLNNWTTMFAIGFWPGGGPDLPEIRQNYFTHESNRRGFRGRAGSWYYGLLEGRGQRNTFVGGMISEAGANKPVQGIFRGASIHVIPGGDEEGNAEELWLSGRQEMDFTGVSWSQETAALGARYTLQPRRYGDRSDLAPTPWKVVQCWAASPYGTMGLVRLERVENVSANKVTGKINIGPGEATKAGNALYQSGKLKVKVFDAFNRLKIEPSNDPRSDPGDMKPWSAVGFEKENWHTGEGQPDNLFYTTWVGPENEKAPENMGKIPDDDQADWLGWTANWENGRKMGVVFNSSDNPLHINHPITEQNWNKIYVNGQPVSNISKANNTQNYLLAPGAVMLLINRP